MNDSLSSLIWGPRGKPAAPPVEEPSAPVAEVKEPPPPVAKRGVPVRVIEVRDVPIRVMELQPMGFVERCWSCKRVGPMPGTKKDLDGEEHGVTFGPFDSWSCDCRAWQFRQSCRHVDACITILKESS